MGLRCYETEMERGTKFSEETAMPSVQSLNPAEEGINTLQAVLSAGFLMVGVGLGRLIGSQEVHEVHYYANEEEIKNGKVVENVEKVVKNL